MDRFDFVPYVIFVGDTYKNVALLYFLPRSDFFCLSGHQYWAHNNKYKNNYFIIILFLASLQYHIPPFSPIQNNL